MALIWMQLDNDLYSKQQRAPSGVFEPYHWFRVQRAMQNGVAIITQQNYTDFQGVLAVPFSCQMCFQRGLISDRFLKFP